jgi:hypothetical protein
MKIKDFTVGQVVYAFDGLNLMLTGKYKGEPKKYTVAKIGRKYLYAARGEIKKIETVPNYLLTDFREPKYTDEFLEINADYGRITILFPDMTTAERFFEKKKLANLFKTEVKWEDYSLDKLQEVQKILGV